MEHLPVKRRVGVLAGLEHDLVGSPVDGTATAASMHTFSQSAIIASSNLRWMPGVLDANFLLISSKTPFRSGGVELASMTA